MSETPSCRWVASDHPRVLPGRHGDDCAGDECRGCQPCREPHCRVCGRTHANGTCAECLAETREALRDIARMCSALPTEVKHRGVESEAMNLLGPSADPEARAHVEASYLVGRLPEGWLEANHGKACPLLRNEACIGCAGDERHPLLVLASWQDVYAEEFEHEITRRATIADAAGYLDRNLTYAAEWPHVPFEDFARDLRRCLTHLESVLHDQRQGDRANVGCFECGDDLERRLCKDGFEDFWTCKGCRRRYTYAEYNFALRAKLEESA